MPGPGDGARRTLRGRLAALAQEAEYYLAAEPGAEPYVSAGTAAECLPGPTADAPVVVANQSEASRVPISPPGPKPSPTLRGSCDDCAWHRPPTSPASTAFAAMSPYLQAALRSARTQALVEEDQRRGDEEEQLRTRLQAPDHLGRDLWGARPTGWSYCGREEFAGRYGICEIRNGEDRRCTSFALAGPGRPACRCEGCAHLRRSADSTVRSLFEVLVADGGTPGAQIRDGLVKPALTAQAQDDYQGCVDFGGVVPHRPVLLPLCAAHSPADADGGWVVGPVVNAAGLCPTWAPGSAAVPGDGQEEALGARVRALKEQMRRVMTSPRPGDPMWIDLRDEVGGLRSRTVAIHLERLGLSAELVDEICAAYASNVWNIIWTRDDVSQQPHPAGPTPTSQPPDAPEGVFVAVPGHRYPHPARPGVALTVHAYPAQLIPVPVVLVEDQGQVFPFELARLPAGEWVQLLTEPGCALVTLNADPVHATYLAAWRPG